MSLTGKRLSNTLNIGDFIFVNTLQDTVSQAGEVTQ